MNRWFVGLVLAGALPGGSDTSFVAGAAQPIALTFADGFGVADTDLRCNPRARNFESYSRCP